MANSYKAKALADELRGKLLLRLPVITITGGTTAGFDSSGNPTLAIGTGTTTTQSAFIRVKAITGFGTDILGTTQNVYTPHVIEVALETSTIASVAFLTAANMLNLLGELVQTGVRVDLYLSANGTAPVVGSITGAPVASFNGHLQYPLAGQ